MSKVAKWIFPAAGGKDGIIGTAKAVVGFMTGNWGMIASGAAQVAGLGKKKQAAQERQANVTTLSVGEVPREAVLGQTCTAGSLIDVFSFGGKHGTDTVTYCVGLADHALDGIVGYYVDDQYYPWTGEGFQPGFSNKLSLHFRQATADGWVPPAHVLAAGAGWKTTDRLAGIAHIWIDTHLDDKVWSRGWPKFKFVLRGLRAFDPRFDPALGYAGPNPQTWEDRASHRFTTNAALLRYAVARGIYAEGHHGEEEHLLIGRGLSAEEAPPARIIAAANLCDELVNGKPRYAASGVINTSDDFATVEEMFATAMAGMIVQREGGVEVEPGQAKAAVVTITDADLVTGAAASFSRFRPDGSDGRINTVVSRYIEPAQGYKDHAGPVRRSIPDIQKDHGPREMTLVQMLVTDVDQADRNAEIARRRSRCERRSQIVLPPAFAALEEGDWIAWQSDRYHDGATVRYLVETFDLNKEWRNSLSLTEIASSVFGGVDPVEDRPNPPPPPPVIDALSLTGVAVEAVTLAADPVEPTEGESAAGGSTVPAIRFRWDVLTPPPEGEEGEPTEAVDAAIRAIRAEVRVVGGDEVAPTRTEEVRKGVLVTTNGVGANQTLEARLVPIGEPWRPVLPSAWFTVTTGTLIAGDTTHVGGVPVGEIPALDTTPPGVPAGLVLSSTSTPDAAGNPYVRINATWTANTDEDLNGYEVEVTESGFTIVEAAPTNRYGRAALTGRSYAIRVRAIDKAGNRSDWSPVQNVTGAGDTTPPSAPTALAVSVSLGSFFLEWTNPSASDLSKIEVWEHTSNASGSATRIATVNAQSGAKGSYARSGMVAGAVRYFWLKAVDTSGNASVFSAGASGTIPTIPAGEIDTTPPGVPTGLSLSTALVTDAGTGLPRPRVVATWTAPGDADLAGFDVEITEAGGNPVTRMVSAARDQWDSRPNVSYQVRVRAFDRVGNRSAWTASQSITAPADAVAPAAPTALAAVASVGSIFLSGVAPSDLDTAKIEVWENTTNNSGTATRIAVVNAIPGMAWAHPRTGLSANDTRWYWAKAVDTSGNASAFSTGISRTVPYVANPDIAVGTLAGDRLLANSVEGSVFKTNTSLPGTIEVGSTGVTIETIRGQANDPAARINANTTKIDPGKITLWGSGSLTDLPDWRMGGDVTRMDGGKISANTIRANSVEVGLRGVYFDRFNFTEAGGVLTWGIGRTTYTNDAGATVIVEIAAGSHTYVGPGVTYVYWTQGASVLSFSKVASEANGPNAVIVGTFYGAGTFTAGYGRTVINGDQIQTGTLETRHHSSLSITTGLLAAGAVTGEKVTANSFDGSVFKTNTSLPGTITVGSTGVTIQTIQDQAANPATTINGGTTKIDPGLITISGGSTLASWRHGSDQTKIDGGNIFANSIKANSLEVGLRGVYFDRFNFTEAGGVLTWGIGRTTYTNDAGATVIVEIAAGSHTYVGPGVTYVYWTQGASVLSFSKVASEANGPNAVIVGTFYGAGTFTAGYGRTVINGDQIQTGAITAIKINVIDLSAISANIGNITAGKIGNSAGTTFFDLTNARQQFNVGGYVWRQGSLGSGVLTWFGPSSVTIGSETRTNGAFATGTDGLVYYGAAPLTPGSGVIVPKIVSVSAQTAAITFDNALTDGIWDMSLYALSAPGWVSGAPSGTWAIYEQNVGSAGTAGTLIASGSVRPNGDYEPTTFDFGGGASSAVKVAGNRQLRVIVSGISATNLIFRATYSSATGGGGGGGSGGGSTGPALSDTAPPVIASAGAVGTAATAARGDHTHAHGNQGGGALHANATPTTDGFQSAADKSKMNGVQSGATANSSDATLLNRANHTGTQAWSTITGAPAITGLTATTTPTASAVVQRTSSGAIEFGAARSHTGTYYFTPTEDKYLRGRTVDSGFVFSHGATGPSFTPTSDLVLKVNIEAVSNDPAAVRDVLSAGQIQYDRVQDGVHALGFSAQALRDINPLWVVGGEVLDPEGPVEDLEGAVIDEDGVTFRRPLAVDPMAMISSAFAAVRQLANDAGYLEARHEQALSRIEALEATVAALTAA